MGCRRRIYLELSLAANLIDWSLVCKLSDKLVSLNINILFAWWRLRRFHVTSEELLRSFSSLLLQTLRIIFALVCLEELIWVGARWDDHGSIGAATENTLVIHDVLREVLILIGTTIRVLILLLLSDHTRVSSESLSASSATRLLQHF